VRRYRRIGIIVLLVGIVMAGVVYWRGTREVNLADDPAMTGFNRGEARQMAILYGTQGELIEELTTWLKQPGTQAVLIAIAAAIVAAGSFYFARVLEDEAREVESAGPAHDRAAPPN
jgi:hypothetical protein